MSVRYTITFLGRVQGVGFRATTIAVADGFSVTGWVRNERDGSVLCIAEGERAELDRFVEAVKRAMEKRYVHDTHIGESPATGEFKDFEMRRWGA